MSTHAGDSSVRRTFLVTQTAQERLINHLCHTSDLSEPQAERLVTQFRSCYLHQLSTSKELAQQIVSDEKTHNTVRRLEWAKGASYTARSIIRHLPYADASHDGSTHERIQLITDFQETLDDYYRADHPD